MTNLQSQLPFRHAGYSSAVNRLTTLHHHRFLRRTDAKRNGLCVFLRDYLDLHFNEQAKATETTPLFLCIATLLPTGELFFSATHCKTSP